MNPLQFETYDYVIAGGGTAGCVLANRLSADPSVKVLLLEAGGADDWFWIHVPVGYLRCIGNARTDWCYRIEPEAGLNGRSIGYARGKVLGGCSSINGMLCLRGQSNDYDEWARLTGDPRWSWKNVLPVFRRSEDHWRGADDLHGTGANGGWSASACVGMFWSASWRPHNRLAYRDARISIAATTSASAISR